MIKINKILLFINIVIFITVVVVAIAYAWTNPSNPPPSHSVFSGAVWFFNLPSCPNGWSELTSAQGRYIVGLPSGGALAAIVGTALTDRENRAVRQHTHTGSTESAGTHSHSVNAASGSGGSWGLRHTTYGDTLQWESNYGLASSGSHSHTVTVNDSGTVAGTNAPYIQLLVCQKN